jgi:hypothetical protein
MKLAQTHMPPSSLTHEYDIYQSIVGCKGVSPIRWYGKKGPYDVLILDHLGTSLNDLVRVQQLNSAQSFFLHPKWCVYYAYMYTQGYH